MKTFSVNWSMRTYLQPQTLSMEEARKYFYFFFLAAFNILTQKVADKTHFPNINKCIKKKRGQEKKPENRQQIKQH